MSNYFEEACKVEEALLAVARCVAGQRKFHLVNCYA